MCLEPDEAMLNTLHALQYEPEVLGLLNHGAWIDYLKTTADITLCCSLAESYGFVASEAMQIGVPVVASNAIKFAHDELTIKHNTPQMIADRIEHAITHHERLAGECSSLASVEADYQIVEYLRQLRRIAV